MSREFWIITLNFSILLALYFIIGICHSPTKSSMTGMAIGSFLMWIFSSAAIGIKLQEKKKRNKTRS